MLFIQPLILVSFFVILVYWLADAILTKKVVGIAGYEIEANPVIRLTFKIRAKFFLIFKLVEISLFAYLIYLIDAFQLNIFTAFYAIFGLIVYYTLILINNSRVYFEVTKKQSNVLIYALSIATIFLIIFMWFAYTLQIDKTILTNQLLQGKAISINNTNVPVDPFLEKIKQWVI